MPGSEKPQEYPKLTETVARDKLKKAAGNACHLNDPLTDKLVAQAQSDDWYTRSRFDHTLSDMKFANDHIQSFKRGAKDKLRHKRILACLNPQERSNCKATSLLLTSENYRNVLNDTLQAHNKYDEFFQLIYEREIMSEHEPEDTMTKKLLASPEEMAQVVQSLSAEEARSYLFKYRYHVGLLAKYTVAGLFTETEAEDWADRAKTDPDSLEDKLESRKAEYENGQHASADRILDDELNRVA